jgi:hypothetical protein
MRMEAKQKIKVRVGWNGMGMSLLAFWRVDSGFCRTLSLLWPLWGRLHADKTRQVIGYQTVSTFRFRGLYLSEPLETNCRVLLGP